MTSSANTYENQRELYENIKKIGINIKKDGWDRKNLDYFKRRMQMLENLWSEFQFNHDRLSTEVSAGHPYFTSDLYNTALMCYKEVKELILQQNQQLSTHKRSIGGPAAQPTTPFESTSEQNQASTSSKKEQEQQDSEEDKETSNTNESNNRDQSPPRQQQSPNKRDTGSNSKLDDLLRKQSANFKAFMRAVANIQVEFITEKWEFQDALQTVQARWSAIDSLHWEIECELNGDKNAEYEQRYTSTQYLKTNTSIWRRH